VVNEIWTIQKHCDYGLHGLHGAGFHNPATPRCTYTRSWRFELLEIHRDQEMLTNDGPELVPSGHNDREVRVRATRGSTWGLSLRAPHRGHLESEATCQNLTKPEPVRAKVRWPEAC